MSGMCGAMKSQQPEYPDAPIEDPYMIGMEFEDFVRDKCSEIGLVLQRFSSFKYQLERGDGQVDEIKLDTRCTDTGRLSIEIAEKSKATNPSFVSSGIYADSDFWLYIQGNEHIIFIFPRNLLQLLHRTGRYKEHQMKTIKKYYLPLSDALKYAAKVIPVDEIGKALMECP